MGRLTRWLAAGLVVFGFGAAWADAAAAFDGFGTLEADSTYAQEIRFDVALPGGAPDRMELLLRTPGSDASFAVPVETSDASATYVWDTSVDYLTPNTLVTYQWRATDGDEVRLSDPATIRYVDDRPGLDWQTAQLGEATVHWYGGAQAQAQALRFGELTAVGVEQAEALLGTQLAGPVDVFIYDTEEEFFGALGPGAREWTGAAAYSEIRTIFMYLGGGSAAYLETAMLHEVTHIVFHDATDNPFHEPARWLNEGIASWSESSAAVEERSIVEAEASGAGLFAFDAITEQFPIGERGGRLSYAQGTTMIDLIVDRYGPEAVARIAAAYQDGASDAEALEAGTGIATDELYTAYYESFGVEEPTPISPEPIAASSVERPVAGEIDPGGVDPVAESPGTAKPGEDPLPVDTGSDAALVIGLAAVALVAGVAAVLVSRRAARRSGA